jgi:RNA polymerase sigma-70 factor (ECF subfamily)
MPAVSIPSVGIAQGVSEQLFTELLAPLVQPAYRLAWAVLRDPQAAEDVVQDASLIAWRKVGRLDDPSHMRAWFLGIVANVCRNSRKRKWATGVSFGLPPTLSVASSEERVVRGADLTHALRQLPYEDRMVVVLYFYLDLTTAEVATIAGASVEATRSRLYRAVRRLRPDLEIGEAIR